MALVSTDTVLPHIARAYAVSECRTPLICCRANGDPLPSVQALAKQKGLTVWTVALDFPSNEQNALDYLEVGLQNGDWLMITECEKGSFDLMRQIAFQLFSLAPDPARFAQRELFRLWLVVQEPVDLDERTRPLFPALLTQNAILVLHEPSENRCKVVCKQPADPELAAKDRKRKEDCKQRGLDSDEEFNERTEDPGARVTGMWFHRALDLYTAESTNAVSQSFEDIFTGIEKGDVELVTATLRKQVFDINVINKAGLTPLMWAVLCDNLQMVRLLLENKADPRVKRIGKDTPVIFLPIEQPEMLQLLVDFGADLNETYEGHSLKDHPETSPTLRDFLLKGELSSP
eukprot:RCo026886